MRIITIILVCLITAAVLGQADAVKINSIHFKGNESFGEGNLLSLMALKQSSWFTNNYFDPDDLKDDLKSIKTFYISRGFPDIDIESCKFVYNDDSSEVNILISLNEGSPTIIKEVKFRGNRFFSDEEIFSRLNLQKGERYEESKIFRSRNSIKKLYLNEGFLDATIEADSVYFRGDHSTNLVFIIVEGTRYKIDKIKIEGLDKVKPGLVTRELEFSENEFVSLELLTQTQKKLYHTLLFRSVIITPLTTSDSSKKDILIKLTEDNLGLFDIAVGFGTLDKYRVSSEVSYRNFLGRGYRAVLKGKISAIEESIQPSITDPWIFGIPWGLDIFGQLALKKEPSFRYKYWEAGLNFYKEFLERSKLILTGTYEGGNISDFRFQVFAQDISDSTLTPELIDILNQLFSSMKITIRKTSAKVSLVHDLRDNLFDPSTGLYLNVSTEYITGDADVEILGISFRSRNNIMKSEALLKYFYSPESSTIIASSLSLGLINNFTKDEDIFLLDELFYAGGPNSIRGFGYQLAGPLSTTGAPTGGKVKLVWNLLEIRQHIIWIIGAVAFLDAGNVWSNPADFKLKTIRYSPGLGLRVNTPIGLARLDYGFNPWPKPGESKGHLWFGIGYSF